MTRPFRLTILLLCLLASGLISCFARRPFPPGPALKEPVTFELALFYTEPPRQHPRAALDALLTHDFPGFTRVDEIHEKEIGHRRLLSAVWLTDARKSYVAPDLNRLRYFGRGLDEAQAAALQRSENVLVLNFGYGKEHLWAGMRDALRLTDALARRTGGLIWDDESREMFTPDFWAQHRIATWTQTAGPPDLSNHFTIHFYRKENGLDRAISLGLKKFGLPDIIADNFTGSTETSMINTMDLLVQSLAEGAVVGRGGDFDLDLHRLRLAAVRNKQLESLGANATAKARLRLVRGTWEEGDPDNRLAEIRFDRYPGPDEQARQERTLADLFGTKKDEFMDHTEHDAAVLAASRRAREKLLALKPAFLAGLPPGEVLLVKAPFRTPTGGNEWMWVEVIQWKGRRISGSLRNEPVYVKSLKEGQRVEVSEADVFDYIHRFANGSDEGNETAKYLHPTN